jgi:hypothetical protein
MSLPPAVGGAGRLHLVVAFDKVGGIGKDGTIPWSLSPDLKRFKELTTSLPPDAQPGSFNVVIMVTIITKPTPPSPPLSSRSVSAGQEDVGFPPFQIKAFGGSY